MYDEDDGVPVDWWTVNTAKKKNVKKEIACKHILNDGKVNSNFSSLKNKTKRKNLEPIYRCIYLSYIVLFCWQII